MPATLTVAEVAALLGMTRTRVVQLDSVLLPERDAYGHRLFDPEVVERVRAHREAKFAARSRPRDAAVARLHTLRERTR